jgi:hypothetical protein
MLIRVYSVVLLLALLMAVAGCSSKSEVVQQTNSTQPTASPQQAAPAASATSNTQSEQQSPSAEAGATKSASDPCSLITSAEIQEVQGEAVKETKSTPGRASGSFLISQCFYSLPTYSKSVSLEVTQSSSAGGGEPGKIREFWNKAFHGKGGKEEEERGKAGSKEEEREKEQKAEKEERGRGEEEEGEGSKPRPVTGIGDEAFWSGNARAGALYVLKNNAFIRISIGGNSDEAAKIDKSKTLARKALARL